jgi:putative ABC transport system permease protein
MKYLTLLAARNVARHRRRSAITLFAVVLGVMIVVVLKGFADGFINLVVNSVVDGRTGALQVHRAGYFKDREALPLALSFPQTRELEARMLAVAGVKGLAGRIQFSGLVSDGSGQATFLGTAIDPAAEKNACPNWGKDIVRGGADLSPTDYGQALLGIGLAKSLKGAGDSTAMARRLTLSAVGPTGRMNALEVSVKGVTETALRFENKRLITVTGNSEPPDRVRRGDPQDGRSGARSPGAQGCSRLRL